MGEPFFDPNNREKECIIFMFYKERKSERVVVTFWGASSALLVWIFVSGTSLDDGGGGMSPTGVEKASIIFWRKRSLEKT